MTGPRHLDPKVRIIWLFPTAIIILFVWIIGTAFSIFAPEQLSYLSLGLSIHLFPILLLVALLAILGLPSYAWVHMNYVNFTYELGAQEVIIREGVFTRKRTVIPYGRIQDISTERTVLERALGTATLNIETAGTNVGASEGILPGITDYEKVIGEIMSHVQRTKKGSGGLGAAEEMLEEETGVMEQILDEVRETNRLLREYLLHTGRNPGHSGNDDSDFGKRQ